jgi:hypothetical protein
VAVTLTMASACPPVLCILAAGVRLWAQAKPEPSQRVNATWTRREFFFQGDCCWLYVLIAKYSDRLLGMGEAHWNPANNHTALRR